MPVAFKEWAVTVRALAEGEQLLTLRKGGIREENKHFEIEHDRFFLYPTFDHQRNDLVRESHMPELGRALEEGVWPDGEPPAAALAQDGGIPQPDRVRIRAWAEVAASYLITDPRAIDALSPYYIWTTDYAEKRLAWKRRHPLHVIVLRTYRIPRPVTVKVRDPSTTAAAPGSSCTATCRSRARPVLSDDEFERAAGEIEAIASDAVPGPRVAPTASACPCRARRTSLSRPERPRSVSLPDWPVELVVAAAAVQAVIAGAPRLERVLARVAEERVLAVAGPADDAVVARAGADDVVAAAPVDLVVALQSDDDVGALRALEPVALVRPDDRRRACRRSGRPSTSRLLRRAGPGPPPLLGLASVQAGDRDVVRAGATGRRAAHRRSSRPSAAPRHRAVSVRPKSIVFFPPFSEGGVERPAGLEPRDGHVAAVCSCCRRGRSCRSPGPQSHARRPRRRSPPR